MENTLQLEKNIEKQSSQRDLMIKVAKMYYEDNRGQQDIADALGMSRSNVSKLLILARKNNVVDIRINDVSLRTITAVDSLKERFGLQEVILAPSDDDYEVNLFNIGTAAAEYLESIVKNNMRIGITWGSSIYYTVSALKAVLHKNIGIVQLMGGTNWNKSYKYGVHMVLDMADKMGATPYLMNAPLMVSNPELKKSLLEEKTMQKYFQLCRDIDIALVGIGSNHPDYTPLIDSGVASKSLMEKYWNEGIRSHICSRMIEMDGSVADIENNKKVVGIELSDLKKVPVSIGIAGGPVKVEPIVACLNGGYINTLVTDEKTAVEILEYKE